MQFKMDFFEYASKSSLSLVPFSHHREFKKFKGFMDKEQDFAKDVSDEELDYRYLPADILQRKHTMDHDRAELSRRSLAGPNFEGMVDEGEILTEEQKHQIKV